MASVHPYRTAAGEARYEVRHRDAAGRNRSRAFTRRRDAELGHGRVTITLDLYGGLYPASYEAVIGALGRLTGT